MAEAGFNQTAGRGVAPVFGVAAQNHGQQTGFAALGRNHDIVARGYGPAGFQAVDPGHGAQQGVGVAHGAASVQEKARTVKAHGAGVRPEIGAAQRHHVAGRGFLSGGGQAGGIFKYRAAHAQAAGLAVHPAYEIADIAAADALGHGHGRIIARSHGHAGEQAHQRHAFAGAQLHGRTARGGGLAADPDLFIEGNAFRLDRVHGQKHAHKLGQRGRRDGRVGALLVEDAACVQIDQHGRTHRQRGLGRKSRKAEDQEKEQTERRDEERPARTA